MIVPDSEFQQDPTFPSFLPLSVSPLLPHKSSVFKKSSRWTSGHKGRGQQQEIREHLPSALFSHKLNFRRIKYLSRKKNRLKFAIWGMSGFVFNLKAASSTSRVISSGRAKCHPCSPRQPPCTNTQTALATRYSTQCL